MARASTPFVHPLRAWRLENAVSQEEFVAAMNARLPADQPTKVVYLNHVELGHSTPSRRWSLAASAVTAIGVGGKSPANGAVHHDTLLDWRRPDGATPAADGEAA